jgi:hypothetical protein
MIDSATAGKFSTTLAGVFSGEILATFLGDFSGREDLEFFRAEMNRAKRRENGQKGSFSGFNMGKPPLKGTPEGGLERAKPPRLGLFLSSKGFLKGEGRPRKPANRRRYCNKQAKPSLESGQTVTTL